MRKLLNCVIPPKTIKKASELLALLKFGALRLMIDDHRWVANHIVAILNGR